MTELAASATEYHTGNVSGYFSPTFIAQDGGNIWQNERRNAYETNSVLSANSETITNWLSPAVTRTEAFPTPPDVYAETSEIARETALIANNAPTTTEYYSRASNQEENYSIEKGEPIVISDAMTEAPPAFAAQDGGHLFREEESARILDAYSDREPVTEAEPEERRETSAESGNGGKRDSEQVKRILIDINGSGAIDIGRNSPEQILSVMLTHLEPVLMEILRQEKYEEGDASYVDF